MSKVQPNEDVLHTAAKHVSRYIPEAAWDVTAWTSTGPIVGTVDAADRLRLVAVVLLAVEQAPEELL